MSNQKKRTAGKKTTTKNTNSNQTKKRIKKPEEKSIKKNKNKTTINTKSKKSVDKPSRKKQNTEVKPKIKKNKIERKKIANENTMHTNVISNTNYVFETDKTNETKFNFKKFFIIVGMISIVIISITLLFTLSVFDVEKVNIVGNQIVTYDQVFEASDILYGTNLFNSMIVLNREKILKIPYVKDINLSLVFPNEIVIEVEERIAKYYAFDYENNRYFTIDEEGRVLNTFSDLKNITSNELLTQGITFDKDVTLGTDINDVDLNKLKYFEQIKQQIDSEIDELDITKIKFTEDTYVVTLSEKIDVILNEEIDIEYSVKLLDTIISQIGFEPGTIDMRVQNPIFIKSY